MQAIIQMALFLGLSAIAQQAQALEEMPVAPTSMSAQTTTQPVRAGSLVAPVADRPVVRDPRGVYQEEVSTHVLTWTEYVLTYEGLCPREQPEHPFKHDWQYLAAIGLKYWDGKTAEGYLQQAWGWWRNGEVSGITYNHSSDEQKFYVDWDTLMVVGNSYLTSVLQGFESEYNAKCLND